MMINFPRIHTMKKISRLESSTQKTTTSSMSAPSSFEKPELSKAGDSGARNKIQTKRRRSQQQQHEKDSNTNQIRKSSVKSQNNVEPSATSLSGIDPVAVKAVTFEKTARVRRVRPRSQFSQTEREAMWYSDNDYTDIKRRAVETVKRMMKGEKSGGFVDDDNYTSRGLECRMKKNAVERKRFKSYARGLVLEEQDYQNETGIMCPGRLRKVYLKSSSIALMKAQDNGQKDAEVTNDVSLCEIRRINLENNNLL